MLNAVIISAAGDNYYYCLMRDFPGSTKNPEASKIEMKPIKTFSAIFMVLVLAACAQTTATKTTSPRPAETRQTPPAESEASSESSESGQQESQVDRQAHHPETGRRAKSKSDETTPAEAASDQKAEPRSETPAQSKSQKSSTAQTSKEDSAEAKLAQAQEDLRISRETEKRIATELEQLKESGSGSEEAVRDYETYLESVAAMTAENHKIVKQLEAVYAEKTSGKTGSNELDKIADPDIPEEQAMDEVVALDSQLNASLAKFDGMLLEEMDEIRAGSSEKLQDLAAEAAEAAKRLREKGLDVNTSGSKSSGESQGNQEAGRQGTETASRDGSGKGGEGPSSTDQRRRDYEDDDIVARQLREAAENETDPELKEKLWKEYEEYKKNK